MIQINNLENFFFFDIVKLLSRSILLYVNKSNIYSSLKSHLNINSQTTIKHWIKELFMSNFIIIYL